MANLNSGAYVSSRRIGGATVSVIRDGTWPWAPELQAPEEEWRAAMPEANAAGELMIDMNLALVQIGDATIVIDLGCGDPTPEVLRRRRGYVPTPGMVAGLASLGVRPEDVTHVVITHAHGDHVEGATIERGGERVPRYPHARYLLSEADWPAHNVRAQVGPLITEHLDTLDRLGRLDRITGNAEVAPGVTLLHAPGESPGHSIVRVQSDGEAFYYLGDLFHHPAEVARLDWVSPGRNRELARASRERLIAEAVPAAATLVFTHHPFPGWGRIVASKDTPSGYTWKVQTEDGNARR